MPDPTTEPTVAPIGAALGNTLDAGCAPTPRAPGRDVRTVLFQKQRANEKQISHRLLNKNN
jgi:hypothetical protein